MFKLTDYMALWELSRCKHKATCTVFDDMLDCLPVNMPEVWICGDVAACYHFNIRGRPRLDDEICAYFEDILNGFVNKPYGECIKYSYILFKLDGRNVICF